MTPVIYSIAYALMHILLALCAMPTTPTPMHSDKGGGGKLVTNGYPKNIPHTPTVYVPLQGLFVMDN